MSICRHIKDVVAEEISQNSCDCYWDDSNRKLRWVLIPDLIIYL